MKLIFVIVFLSLSLPLAAETSTYRVYSGGQDIGYLKVDQDGDNVVIDFDYKQNGRGPTMTETLVLDERGFPIDWTITGLTTFGSEVDEFFVARDGVARWKDATGEDDATFNEATRFYISQNGGLFSTALLARALLADEDQRFDVFPSGTASIVEKDSMTLSGENGSETITAYQIFGLSRNPSLIFLDTDRALFGTASSRFSMIREGFSENDERLRLYAEQLSTDRFVDIQRDAAHRYDEPVRIRNVHVFEPESLSLSGLKDVLIYGRRIASIQDAGSPGTDSEILIDGDGGTLIPGMYEMHGHIGQENALLNIAAGITSVRDMGNENAVLEGLMDRIESGEIAGPRITRSCFIEGESEFSAATGETVATLEEALDMVRWCGSRDFHQVKLYNLMRPEWARTLVAEAHRLGMRVAGHVPAFSSANEMIEAGFDEITHANQLMLGWVLNEDEDTRTLFRFTAMKRFPQLDLDGEPVRFTIGRMLERNVAHDPTMAIHEHGMTAVNGEVAPMGRKIIDHLPTNEQRSLKTEFLGASTPKERAEYVAAFEFVMATMQKLHREGVFLVPGTDLGGSFAYHRELELFEKIGLTPAEVLRRASFDIATYLGQVEDLGSIEKGKYADFFLVPGDPTESLDELRRIRMVVADGVVYFPSDIYPHFGIRPFIEAPTLTEAPAAQ